MKVGHEIAVAVPQEALFAALADRERIMGWLRSGARTLRQQGDGTHTGDVIETIEDRGGQQMRITHVVLEHRPPDLLAYATEMPGASSTVANRLRGTGDGRTLWRVDSAITLHGSLPWLSELLMRPAVLRQLREGMRKIADRAERELA